MRKYAKGLVGLAGAVLVSVASVYGDTAWVTIALSFVTAFGVYMVPNLPE